MKMFIWNLRQGYNRWVRANMLTLWWCMCLSGVWMYCYRHSIYTYMHNSVTYADKRNQRSSKDCQSSWAESKAKVHSHAWPCPVQVAAVPTIIVLTWFCLCVHVCRLWLGRYGQKANHLKKEKSGRRMSELERSHLKGAQGGSRGVWVMVHHSIIAVLVHLCII